MERQELVDFLSRLTKKKRMAKAKHIHQYEKVDIGKKGSYIVFKCQLPNCAHYLQPELVVGRLSICPHCSEPFVIRQSDLQLVKPHCEHCIDEKARSNSLQRKNLKDRAVVSASLGDKLLNSIQKQKGA